MPIDQADLKNLLTALFPKDNLTALREYRNGLQKKLAQGTGGNSARQDKNSINADSKQVIVELQATDKNLQQAIYEDETRKIELERLKREEAAAKKMREREKALARHERVLSNASMAKLLAAVSKLNPYTTAAGSPAAGCLSGQGEAIERDLKEAAEFGIAAAQVARRRKDNEQKANNEEAAGNKARQEKAKKRSINITI